MRHGNRAVYSWILCAFLGVITVSSLTFAQISGATKGQPVIATGATTGTSDGSYWDAKQFTGSDICAKINAAWTTVVSGTIDARGITGAQTCAASPFPSGISGKLLLGNTQITTSVTWQIPSRVHVEGIGIAGLNTGTTANTLIKAGSGLTGAVLQLGTGSSAQFDAQVKGLTVDAAGIASIGILNNSAGEGSTVEDVNIYNATSVGLSLQANSSTSPNNSGPYRNINIQYNTECSSANCSSSTIGIAIGANTTHSSSIRGIDNVTVSGVGTSFGFIGSCIQVIGYPVQITNSHVEFCSTGIQIGATGSAQTENVQVENVSTFPGNAVHWNLTIDNASNILLSGIGANSTDVLQDNVTGNTITGSAGNAYWLGYYLLGDNSGALPAVISTSAVVSSGPHGTNLEWVAPGGLDVLNALQKPAGSFKIDDPRDPANKYLYHSFVESPDMMNVYNGSVITDKHGMATVTLPEYFEALNGDFRYQLTAIGTLAQATVAKKIENNHFAIRTSKPGVEVSWQVTGIRRDAYANAHRIQVEEQKPSRERGHYLHREVFDDGRKEAITKEGLSK